MIRTAGALAVVVATGVDEARRHAGIHVESHPDVHITSGAVDPGAGGRGLCQFQTDRASVHCV